MVRLHGGLRSSAAAVVAVGTGALAGGALADVPAPRQISVDPFTDTAGQHETAVEPDSFSFGNTVVAVFQVGRMLSGGASGIGWASSRDGGRSWTSGVLPSLTVHGTPAGPFARVSDPVIAYDRVHGVWLANVLAIREQGQGLVSSLVVGRSTDGVTWSGPVVVSPEETGLFTHDKNWIACDNGAASPHAGRCYVAWTGAQGAAMALSTSDDGGLTWSAATTVPTAVGSGWQPVTRPDGALVVVYEGSQTVEAVRSTDGGRTFGPRIVVSALRVAAVPGMRTPSLPSVEVDAAGTIYAAWHDCRYRTGCDTNDIVFTSSPDGTRWTRARRVATARTLGGRSHFVAGLGVDPSTSGGQTRLAVAFYVATETCLSDGCGVQPRFIASADAGRTWSAVEVLAPIEATSSYPNTAGGRFAGDYISTSFTNGGTAVPVFAAASAPFDGRFHQGVFATAIPPLPAATRPVALGAVHVTRTRTRLSAAASITGDVFSPIVSCRLPGVRARVVNARVFGGRAVCVWSLRPGRRGRGTIAVSTPEAEASRTFTFRAR